MRSKSEDREMEGLTTSYPGTQSIVSEELEEWGRAGVLNRSPHGSGNLRLEEWWHCSLLPDLLIQEPWVLNTGHGSMHGWMEVALGPKAQS